MTTTALTPDFAAIGPRITRKGAMPKKIRRACALRMRGYKTSEIAERCEVTPQTVLNWLAKARRNYGWSDVDLLDDVAVPMAIDNVAAHLDYESTTEAKKKGMHTMTLKTLSGRGAFKTHSAVKQETKNETTNVLRVEIALPEMPPGVQAMPLPDGSVLAAPRRALVSGASAAPVASVIDAEVVKE